MFNLKSTLNYEIQGKKKVVNYEIQNAIFYFILL